MFAGATDCGEVRLPARPQVLLAQGGQERRSKVHGLLVAGGGHVYGVMGGWVGVYVWVWVSGSECVSGGCVR